MPSSTKQLGTTTATAAADKAPPFEEALRQLEDIVESMESGDLPLESMLARFEEGTRLVKACQTRLEEAEIKINQLEKNRAGEFSLQPAAEVEEP